MDHQQLSFAGLTGSLKAAGEATRLRILALLAEAELTVSDLTEILRQSQPRLSRHLRLLAEAGLVERFREGSWAFFRLGERSGPADLARVVIGRLKADDAIVVRDRERLFRQLDAARECPAVWISGPPGAGKTSLAASYLKARRLPSIWYDVDSGDTDPASFFHHLTQAAPRTRAKTAALLTFAPEYLSELTAFTRRYFRAFFQRARSVAYRHAVALINSGSALGGS